MLILKKILTYFFAFTLFYLNVEVHAHVKVRSIPKNTKTEQEFLTFITGKSTSSLYDTVSSRIKIREYIYEDNQEKQITEKTIPLKKPPSSSSYSKKKLRQEKMKNKYKISRLKAFLFNLMGFFTLFFTGVLVFGIGRIFLGHKLTGYLKLALSLIFANAYIPFVLAFAGLLFTPLFWGWALIVLLLVIFHLVDLALIAFGLLHFKNGIETEW